VKSVVFSASVPPRITQPGTIVIELLMGALPVRPQHHRQEEIVIVLFYMIYRRRLIYLVVNRQNFVSNW